MTRLAAGPLSLRLGRRQILDAVTLGPLTGGTITGLLGPNGSGKSTLLRALAGVIRVAGPVELDGANLGRLSARDRARQCAFMPQLLPPAVNMLVAEVVLLALRLGDRVARSSAAHQVHDVLDSLGIGFLAERRMSDLSGGQRQMVGLAQALVRSPRLLLLDEPLSALDPRYQFIVMEALRRETRARGMVTVIALHDPGLALRHVTNGVMLLDGRVLAAGAIDTVITPDVMARAYGVRARIARLDAEERVVMIEGLSDAAPSPD